MILKSDPEGPTQMAISDEDRTTITSLLRRIGAEPIAVAKFASDERAELSPAECQEIGRKLRSVIPLKQLIWGDTVFEASQMRHRRPGESDRPRGFPTPKLKTFTLEGPFKEKLQEIIRFCFSQGARENGLTLFTVND
jgi:hypothetical protein